MILCPKPLPINLGGRSEKTWLVLNWLKATLGQVYTTYNITIFLPLFPLLCFVLACHWRHNVFPGLVSPPSIYRLWDAGLRPLNVQRSLEACQSCLIIVSVNLICVCEDKVWPLLYVIVWLTYLIHDPTAQTTGESNCCQMPLNSLSFLKYSIPFSLLHTLLLFFHLSIPGLVSKFRSMFHERWPILWGSRDGDCGLEWDDKQ